jgi:hypothetical protein
VTREKKLNHNIDPRLASLVAYNTVNGITDKSRKNVIHGLAAQPSGIIFACRKMGRGIESRNGIGCYLF